MESRALVTINVGGVLCPNARRSFEAAAARWGADYVELKTVTPDAPAPHFLSFELFRLCPADRIFYIDGSDAIIRSDAPSPFDLCPPTHLGVVRNDPDRAPSIEVIRDEQEIEWALYNHCLGTQYPCAAYCNNGVQVLTRAAHTGMLDRARQLVERLSGPRQLVRWLDQTLLNYAAADLGVPVLLMDETWNYMHSEDIGHWNGMERFVYHFAGSPGRHTILLSLDWQAPARPAAPRPAATVAPIKPTAEQQQIHRLALDLTKEAICRQADQPVTSLDQLRVLPSRSGPVKQAQFMTPEFLFWCNRLKTMPEWHSALWDFVMVCQALWERGMLRAGRRGCGFGVGQEPLPALFASLGCEILATDAPLGVMADFWQKCNQHAASLETLNTRNILPRAEFWARVGFRPVDMTRLPQDLGDFDFLWSCGALECLGGLPQGIEFIGKACRYLRPGGVAVHTTQLNVLSNEKTIDHGPIVLFRRRDIKEMQQRVSDAGCRMLKPDFNSGTSPLDLYVDRPPYGMPHLKMAFGNFIATSFLLIVEKPSAGSADQANSGQ